MKKFNAPLWGGFVLTFVAVIVYAAVFSRWPLTRDVPWAAYVLFAVAVALLVAGFRRAEKKLVPSILVLIGAAIIVLFTFGVTIGSRLPPSAHAPAVGEVAPEFTLTDVSGRPVALSTLIAAPQRKGVLLVFYRGYW